MTKNLDRIKIKAFLKTLKELILMIFLEKHHSDLEECRDWFKMNSQPLK